MRISSPVSATAPREHIYAGNQQFLLGEFFGTWRAWDGIRALDYLLTREEVDSKHIGVTGNSGGGTMTTWLCGVEQRWTMAAPSCFITTFRRNLENELPADTEQCPPRALALGLDQEDFLAALAPKPIIVLAKERDYFDARGSQEAYLRLKRLYKLLDAEENVGLFIGPTYHGYSQENREAMYRWFNGVTKISDMRNEPALRLEEEETLYCTPRGQVAGMQSRPIYSFTMARSRGVGEDPQETARQKRSKRRCAMPSTCRKNVESPSTASFAPDGRAVTPRPHSITYVVDTEPGIHALVYRLSNERIYSRPFLGAKRAVLYVSHHSADAELRQEPLVKELAAAETDSAFFTCDVRGIGDSRPGTCGIDSFLQPYGSDYFYAIHSIMLDYPYIGQKTYDLLRVIDWLGSFGHTEIHLAAKGWGTIPGTFAALLSDAVVQVTLKNALTSYTDVAESGGLQLAVVGHSAGCAHKFRPARLLRRTRKKGAQADRPLGRARRHEYLM